MAVDPLKRALADLRWVTDLLVRRWLERLREGEAADSSQFQRLAPTARKKKKKTDSR